MDVRTHTHTQMQTPLACLSRVNEVRVGSENGVVRPEVRSVDFYCF